MPTEAESLKMIALVDVDSFECQVWQRDFPMYYGHPCVVADRSGRILSVTSEAKLFNITRTHRVPQAMSVCRNLKVFWKPMVHDKPDTKKTREASLEITDVIMKFCSKRKILVERIPTDEWFLDLTDHVDYLIDKAAKTGNETTPDFGNNQVFLESKETHSGYSISQKMDWLQNNIDTWTEEEKLVIAAGVVNKLRRVILSQTKFHSSAGVSTNKLLAKQASKFRKPLPNTMTILSSYGFNRVSQSIPIRNVWKLGGDLGEKVEEFARSIKTMADLRKLKRRQLILLFGQQGNMLYNTARGICHDDVVPRIVPQSVNCSKANLRVRTFKDLEFHLNNLSQDMLDRLLEEMTRNKRVTNSLKIQFTYYSARQALEDRTESSVEKSFALPGNGFNHINIAKQSFDKIYQWGFQGRGSDEDTVIITLKLSARKFLDVKHLY